MASGFVAGKPYRDGEIRSPMAIPSREIGDDWPEGWIPVIPLAYDRFCPWHHRPDFMLSVDGKPAFQGAIGSPSELRTAKYKKGWSWLVTNAGEYAGTWCEPGDMVYAISDLSVRFRDSDFVVMQSNMEPLSDSEVDAILS